jgi:hypothetical protein
MLLTEEGIMHFLETFRPDTSNKNYDEVCYKYVRGLQAYRDKTHNDLPYLAKCQEDTWWQQELTVGTGNSGLMIAVIWGPVKNKAFARMEQHIETLREGEHGCKGQCNYGSGISGTTIYGSPPSKPPPFQAPGSVADQIEQEFLARNNVVLKPDGDYKCLLCDVPCRGWPGYLGHCESKTHKKRAYHHEKAVEAALETLPEEAAMTTTNDEE